MRAKFTGGGSLAGRVVERSAGRPRGPIELITLFDPDVNIIFTLYKKGLHVLRNAFLGVASPLARQNFLK